MYNPEQILYDLQQKRFEIFKAQNPEDGDFDAVFDIAGKKLYAHKFMLSLISTTFKSMLSDRWTKSGEPVTIEGYSFDDFKEFLTFIYSGQCELTEANISFMIDMAEFYDIPALKEECERCLPGMWNRENVYQIVELECKYTLKDFKVYLDRFVKKNFITFLKSDKFQSLPKTTVKELAETYQKTYHQEELFEAIFKWAENRVTEKQKLNPTLNINETIKEELSEILPFIKFERMKDVFFHEFVAKKGFLFSGDEWNEILLARKTKIYVKVIDGNGKTMKGEIQCDDVETVTIAINDVNNICCRGVIWSYYRWPTKVPIKPSTPSKFVEHDKTKWYLVFDENGNLAMKRTYMIKEKDFLLAEMSDEEDEFKMYNKCKIETFCFA